MFGEPVGRQAWFHALRIIRLAVGVLWLGAAAPGLGVEIRDIPKPQRWVTDLTGSIPSASIAEIESTADRIERETGGQLTVVVVGTLNGKEPRPFAAALFNAWGIGRAEQDDGVLIFVALADRRIEILLGSGIDDSKRQRASDEIVQQAMVPRFRAGDPGGALVQGVLECARRIYGLAAPATPRATPEPEAAPPAATTAGPRPVMASRPAYPSSSSTAKGSTDLWLLGIMAGFVALAALFVVWVFRAGLFGPRLCPSCKQPVVLLDETLDDAHLERGELAEERLRSADYEVWGCPVCDQVTKLRRGRIFTSYRRCARCGFVTASEVRTVLQQATTGQEGKVQVDERCANCNHTESSIHATPRLVRRTQPNRRSYSGTSTPRSSNSAPRSFGGGRTSGGGSSGRW